MGAAFTAQPSDDDRNLLKWQGRELFRHSAQGLILRAAIMGAGGDYCGGAKLLRVYALALAGAGSWKRSCIPVNGDGGAGGICAVWRAWGFFVLFISIYGFSGLTLVGLDFDPR